MSGLWQWLLVYALVIWCCWRLLRKYLPDSLWQAQARLSYFFEQRTPAWCRRLGRALRPAVVIPQGCSSHCTSCRSCA